MKKQLLISCIVLISFCTFLQSEILTTHNNGKSYFYQPENPKTTSHVPEQPFNRSITAYIVKSSHPAISINEEAVVAADLNNDGETEVYVSMFGQIFVLTYNPDIPGNTSYIALMDSQGNYISGDPWAAGFLGGTNNNGCLLIQTGTSTSSQLKMVYTGQPNEYPSIVHNWPDLVFDYKKGPMYASLVDTDMDGNMEISLSVNPHIVTDIESQHFIYEIDPNSFSLTQLWESEIFFDEALRGHMPVGDFDGDGVNEFVLAHNENQVPEVRVYECTTGTEYMDSYITLDVQNEIAISTQMFISNLGGGLPEIGVAHRRSAEPKYQIFKINESVQPWYSSNYEDTGYHDYLAATSGDYDCDGYEELLLVNYPNIKMLEYEEGAITETITDFQPTINLLSCDFTNNDRFDYIRIGSDAPNGSLYFACFEDNRVLYSKNIENHITFNNQPYLFINDIEITSPTGCWINFQEGGELYLGANSSLTVTSGSELNFAENCRIITHRNSKIVVNHGADLNIDGAADQNVLIKPDNNYDKWQGIYISGSGTREIDYADISQAENGVYLDEADIGLFKFNLISNCDKGVYIYGDAGVNRNIEENTFISNQKGVYLSNVGSLTNYETRIENNYIYGVSNAGTLEEGGNVGYTGISFANCADKLLLKNNQIENNWFGLYCVFCEGVELLGTQADEVNGFVVYNNVCGMKMMESDPKLHYVCMKNNITTGINIWTGIGGHFTRNMFANNGYVQIEFQHGYPYYFQENDAIRPGDSHIVSAATWLPAGSVVIEVPQNYWGQDVNDSFFSPPENWNYEEAFPFPWFFWGSPTPQGALSTEDYLINCAKEQEGIGNMEEAERLYKYVIEHYPKSKAALYAMDRLVTLNGGTPIRSGVSEVKAYIQDKADYYLTEEMVFAYMYARNHTIECDRKEGLYLEALLAYDAILQSPLHDFDYANTQLNIMYTLLEMEQSGSRCDISRLPTRVRELKVIDENHMALLEYEITKPFMTKPPVHELEEIPDKNTNGINSSVYPNPFNPVTNISFDLPVSCKVRLDVYNVKGQLVKTLINKELNVGVHSVVWNGKNSRNSDVSSGIYLYRIEAEGQKTLTKKMILIK